MKQVIAIGLQDFESLRMNNRFYVDKTSLIRDWWNGGDTVTLITRPRRFGKTLNMSMLNCFFSNKYANRRELFEGLQVWEDADLRKQQGKWPVIFLSFADIKAVTFEDTKASLNQLITRLYNDYDWMMKDSRFTDQDRDMFLSVGMKMDATLAARSLQNLCVWLEKYYGKKVLVFLDEYDTPLQEAYIYGFLDDLVSYIRALFNATFKTNPSLERGIMTGITWASKESILSDLNNLDVVTTSSDKYAGAFGFTEEEVFTALNQQGFTETEKEDVKVWYDGFTFGSMTDIYNPWSVTNYLDKGKLDTYWANTSSNSLIGKLLRMGEPEIKSQFEILLKGGEVTVPVDEQIIYDQLDTSPDAVWSLLLATGYLKIIHNISKPEAVKTNQRPLYTMALTNLEVKLMFEQMVEGWFARTGGLSRFAKAMMQGDVRGMNRYLNDIMLTTMSFFDGGKNPSVKLPENFYHGLVLGLLAETSREYMMTSNRESGYGRYDVVMEPKEKGKPAAILEFKVFDTLDDEKGLEDTVENALRQIEKKKYEIDLLNRGIPKENILRYGFAFRGKECLIRKQ
ncbi:MAG: AAA family ATPase [Clostridia bacterium]|nr:AAA family ATPase [Clostridia bacterium]